MSVKTSISLTDQQAAFARRLVDEGRYASLSAVLQHGLGLLRLHTERQEAETEALRVLIERRWNGEFASSEEMQYRLTEMAKRIWRGYGVAD